MTNIHDIIKQYNGDKPWEPRNVEEDYKEFKDYTYDIKMSIKDINYLLYLLEDYGRETNGPWCKKCRKRFRLSKLHWTSKSVCTDSAVHIAMLGNAHY